MFGQMSDENDTSSVEIENLEVVDVSKVDLDAKNIDVSGGSNDVLSSGCFGKCQHTKFPYARLHGKHSLQV